jgi:hypothetical protein
MALLRKGDAQVRQSLLSAGDILGNILPGLSADSPLVISTVLETLQKCVVDNDGISRNAKLLLLSNKNLERLLGLYARASAPDGGEKNSPAELGHAFLLHATSMPGIGICYKDEGMYPPSGKKGVKLYNTILVSFIEALRPIEDQKQQALLLEILKACPELIKP